jgi:ribosomal protein S18 acetylase RimI-like enzyme
MADPLNHSNGVSIGPEPFASPESKRLDHERGEEIVGRYGWDSEPGTKPTDHDLAVFLVARDPAGAAVGCGALRPLGDGGVEIKRMYVRAHARGAGLGRRLLSALEAEADRHGFHVCRLETGVLQTEAIALYRSAGYVEIERFGAYVDSDISLCFERRLHA